MNKENENGSANEGESWDPIQNVNLDLLQLEQLLQLNREEQRRRYWEKLVRDLRKELEQDGQ